MRTIFVVQMIAPRPSAFNTVRGRQPSGDLRRNLHSRGVGQAKAAGRADTLRLRFNVRPAND